MFCYTTVVDIDSKKHTVSIGNNVIMKIRKDASLSCLNVLESNKRK